MSIKKYCSSVLIVSVLFFMTPVLGGPLGKCESPRFESSVEGTWYACLNATTNKYDLYVGGCDGDEIETSLDLNEHSLYQWAKIYCESSFGGGWVSQAAPAG